MATDFTHCDKDAGLATVTAGGFAYPSDVWSDGTRLAVIDADNIRVLLWNTFPTVNGAPADYAVGQADLVSRVSGAGRGQFDYPFRLTSNENQLVVADAGNDRVLIWNTFPTSSGALPDVVLGQGDFGRMMPNDDNQDGAPDGAPTARTLRFPEDVTLLHNQLFVADVHNNRLLIFNGE